MLHCQKLFCYVLYLNRYSNLRTINFVYFQGQESISDYPVTFHYVSTDQMYDLEFYTYHLRPYGIAMRDVDLNTPVQVQISRRTKSTTAMPLIVNDQNAKNQTALIYRGAT